MAQPSFMSRLRQHAHPEPTTDELAAARDAYERITDALPSRPPAQPTNPFTRSHDELAAQWDAMVTELETMRAAEENSRSQVIWLSSEVDRLTKELATRIEFFELEVDRLTKRADRAVDENISRRSKLELLGKAIMMVIDDEMKTIPETRRESPPRIETPTKVAVTPPRTLETVRGETRVTMAQPITHRDYNSTPPEGHPTSDEDGADAHALLHRLAPVSLKR